MEKRRFTFTRAKLEALPSPQESRVLYYDLAERGLVLEITPTGVRSFRIYRKFKGRPKKITLGAFDPTLPETRELPTGASHRSIF